jgi:hypothetical protein
MRQTYINGRTIIVDGGGTPWGAKDREFNR